MDIIAGHIVVMVVFFFGILISTIAPVLISRRQEHSIVSDIKCHNIIEFCNSVGGGVLLATCFIALIPLVEHSYHKAIAAVGTMLYDEPFAEITILSGFFLVIFIELLVTFMQKKRGVVDNGGQIQSSTHEEEEALFSNREESSHRSGSGHSHGDVIDAKSLLRSIILIITLGIHTLFEGMAIGLINNINTLTALSLATLVHAICCAMALGVNLAKQNISRTCALVVCIVFSLMMPSGIAFGLAMGQIKGIAGLMLTAILQGIATGTFLYVLFIEIIPNIVCSANAGIQTLLMLLGCMFMTLVMVFTDTHHEPSAYSAPLNESTTIL